MNNLIKLIFLFERREKISLVILFFLILSTIFLEFFSIGIVVPVIIGILDKNYLLLKIKDFNYFNFELKNFDSEQILVFLLIITLIIYTLKNFFLYLAIRYQNLILMRIKFFFSNMLYKKYILADYQFYFSSNTAKILRNLREANNITLILQSILNLLSEFLLLIFLFILLFFINYIISSSILIFFIVFSYLLYFLYKVKIYNWTKERQFIEAKINQVTIESISSIKEIKIYGVVNYFLNIFSNLTARYNLLANRIDNTQQIPRILIELIMIYSLIIIIFYLFSLNKPSLEIISFLSFFALISLRAVPAITRITASFQRLRAAQATTDFLINEIQQITSSSNNFLQFSGNGHSTFESLEIKNLNFSYKENCIFNKLSLKIKKNEIFGIFGKSGSGKSTLLNLILGLLRADQGSILFNSKNIESEKVNFNNIVGYVPQNVFLLEDSILNNVAFGINKNSIDVEKALKTIQLSGLSEYVESLPLKSSSIIGENGILISGGQKQRLGIARALYKSSELLILDEATSSLDEEAEKNIYKILINLKKSITIIFISHNTELKKICDNFIDLDNNFKKE
jgi:ABC-type bacteriocin/lantibiotic exporter with double-glycine peptidase domain